MHRYHVARVFGVLVALLLRFALGGFAIAIVPGAAPGAVDRSADRAPGCGNARITQLQQELHGENAGFGNVLVSLIAADGFAGFLAHASVYRVNLVVEIVEDLLRLTNQIGIRHRVGFGKIGQSQANGDYKRRSSDSY